MEKGRPRFQPPAVGWVDTGMRGLRVYLDNCNACHRSDGSGANRTFPNLVKNEAVNANDPISLIHIVSGRGIHAVNANCAVRVRHA